MASSLVNSYLDKKVAVITADSRYLVGILASVDNQTNLVLKSAVERVISTHESDEPSSEVALGLYIVRGDNVCLIGLVTEALDQSIDWSKVRGEAIGGVKHI